MISRSQPSATATDSRDVTPSFDLRGGPSNGVQPLPAATSVVPVDAALAAGISAIAASMARAPVEALAGLADRMGVLARELEARRAAGANVVDLASRRAKR